MLVTAFKTTIFPYIVQLGVILFIFSITSAAYTMFRKPNWQEFVDKFKSAIIAYAVVRGAFAIISFIDKIINGIKL